MQKIILINKYHTSKIKLFFDCSLVSMALILLSPMYVIIIAFLKLANGGPVFFIQKRIGKDGKIFKMYKFRTMKVGSEKLQSKYIKLNEADGPVFKIRNDPRLTPIGKILYQTGLDEIPQLINVLKGEMSLVGPRPLPVNEAKKLKKQYKVRELVKPGITSSWIVSGAHKMKFSKWMELDRKYVTSATLRTDFEILTETAVLLVEGILQKITNFW